MGKLTLKVYYSLCEKFEEIRVQRRCTVVDPAMKGRINVVLAPEEDKESGEERKRELHIDSEGKALGREDPF